MWLTSRDVEVVRWVYDARVTTREQIQRLFFTVGGRTRCQHRLSLLLKHRYLDRLESRPASTPDVYLVSRRSFRGVRLLRASGLDDPLNLQAIAPERLQHTLDIISCRVQFLLAGRVPGFAFAEWRQEEELRAVMGNFGIVPDAYVQLTRQSDGGEKRLAFFIEVERSDKSERLLKEKFRRYGAFYYGGDYERLFGTKALRVLVLLDSAYGILAERRAVKLTHLSLAEQVSFTRFAPLSEFLKATANEVFLGAMWMAPGREILLSLSPVPDELGS